MASPVLLLLGVPESGTSALADALVRSGAALAGPPAGDYGPPAPGDFGPVGPGDFGGPPPGDFGGPSMD